MPWATYCLVYPMGYISAWPPTQNRSRMCPGPQKRFGLRTESNLQSYRPQKRFGICFVSVWRMITFCEALPRVAMSALLFWFLTSIDLLSLCFHHRWRMNTFCEALLRVAMIDLLFWFFRSIDFPGLSFSWSASWDRYRGDTSRHTCGVLKHSADYEPDLFSYD